MTDRNARELLWATVFGAVYAHEFPRIRETSHPVSYASEQAMNLASDAARAAVIRMAHELQEPDPEPPPPVPMCMCGHAMSAHGPLSDRGKAACTACPNLACMDYTCGHARYVAAMNLPIGCRRCIDCDAVFRKASPGQ